MHNETTKTERPMYRVVFSRIKGQDKDGNDILTRPREIGAIWARRNGKKGGRVDFDIMPQELPLRQGVTFIVPVDDDDEGGAQ